nr:ABC transporter permease [Cellulomonas uda]
MSRTGEIGLRRAIGASRARVAAMFWTEGALSGAVGGVTGSALAAVAVVVVAAVNGWTASVNPVSALLGPTIGLVAGVVSSLYPALRAAAVEPAQAVRAD